MIIKIEDDNKNINYGDLIITNENRIMIILKNESFSGSFDYALCLVEVGEIIEVFIKDDESLYLSITNLLKNEYGETITRVIPRHQLVLSKIK